MKTSKPEVPSTRQATETPEAASPTRGKLRGMTYEQQLGAVQLKADAPDPPEKAKAKIPLIAQGNTSSSDLTANTAATFGAEVGGLYDVTLTLADLYQIGRSKNYSAVKLARTKSSGKFPDMIAAPGGTITGAETTGFLLAGGSSLANTSVTVSLAGNGLLCLARLARSVFNGLTAYGVTASKDGGLNFQDQNFEVLGTLTMDNPIADVDARNHTFIGGIDMSKIQSKVTATYRHAASAFMAAWGTINNAESGQGSGRQAQYQAYKPMSKDTAAAGAELNKTLNGLWVEPAGLDPTQRYTYVSAGFDIQKEFAKAVAARDAYNASTKHTLDTPWSCVEPMMSRMVSEMGKGVDLTFIPAEFASFKTRFERNWRKQLREALGASGVWDSQSKTYKKTKVATYVGAQAKVLRGDDPIFGPGATKAQAPRQADVANTEGVIAD
ncbi:MAG: hypothetical protein ACI9MR_002717 [Myxococcota bacterium]|jgi:hypothetical protein